MRTKLSNKSISIFIFLILLGYNSFSQNYAIDRIYLHLNRNIFVSGETCWLQAYNIDINTRKLSNVSNVAYLELLNGEGISILQKEILLDKGIGDTGINFSDKLPSGTYYLNAYTNWNSSINPELISIKEIYLYNNENEQDITSGNLAANNAKYSFTPISRKDTPYLINTEKLKGEIQLVDLNRKLRFNVNSSNLGEINILITDRSSIEKSYQLNLNGSESYLEVPLNVFKGNNLSIKITDSKNEPLHSVSFHSGILKSNYSKEEILYLKTRNTHELSFPLTQFSKLCDTLNLSASIRLKEPIGIPRSDNFTDFNNILIDYPVSSHLDIINSNLNLDSWVSNTNLQPIWTQQPINQEISPTQYPEKNAYIIEGQLINQDSSLRQTLIYFSKIGKFADVDMNITNSDGKFYFKLPLDKGFHDIAIQARKIDSLKIDYALKNKFLSYEKGISKNKSLLASTDGKNFAKKIWQNYYIRKLYKQKTASVIEDTVVNRSKKNFFGKPTYSYDLKKYITLDSLPEYFHELIPTVKIRYNSHQKASMVLFNPESGMLMPDKALPMYDGLIMDNIDDLMNLNPEDLDRIEVVPFEYYYKKSHFYGIVHIISKKGKCELTELPINTERFHLPLFNEQLIRTETEVSDRKTPDARVDMLWLPNILVTKDKSLNLNFTVGDIPGNYELIIEGISEKGEAISYKRDIVIE